MDYQKPIVGPEAARLIEQIVEGSIEINTTSGGAFWWKDLICLYVTDTTGQKFVIRLPLDGARKILSMLTGAVACQSPKQPSQN